MTQLSVSPALTQNIARAKSLIKRDELARALEALLAALNLFEPDKIIGRARSVVEVNLIESVAELNAHADVQLLLRELTKSDKASIPYKPGGESQLAGVLALLHKAMTEAGVQKEQAAEDSLKDRKESLMEKAREHIAADELPRAKAVLRKLAEEFGREAGTLGSIGSVLAKFDFQHDAVEYLEQAIAAFPRVPEAYTDLIACYFDLKEYEKCEKTYFAVIREFGKHPRTLVNLGKLYIAWNKRDKAFNVLNEVTRKDPTDKEAAELFAKVDR